MHDGTTRNYKGHVGSPDAWVYTGPPCVAAVAALTCVVAYLREHGDFPRV